MRNLYYGFLSNQQPVGAVLSVDVGVKYGRTDWMA